MKQFYLGQLALLLKKNVNVDAVTEWKSVTAGSYWPQRKKDDMRKSQVQIIWSQVVETLYVSTILSNVRAGG